MPRAAREKSLTGIYHVMLRGIDKRDIFLKNLDYNKFISHIKRAKEKSDFSIYAYCLMTNHVHLLIKTESEAIGDVVRRIAVSYAQYHNIENGRTGHLFQNRFKSEPVNTDRYFLTVLRYIHQNPIQAGLVKKLEDYHWSSYQNYINQEFTSQKNSDNDNLIDYTYVLKYFNDLKSFETFMKEITEDQCLEFNQKKRYTDEKLREKISLLVDIATLDTLNKKLRDKTLKDIKEKTGASNRQLARVLKVGRSILDKIK